MHPHQQRLQHFGQMPIILGSAGAVYKFTETSLKALGISHADTQKLQPFQTMP